MKLTKDQTGYFLIFLSILAGFFAERIITDSETLFGGYQSTYVRLIFSISFFVICVFMIARLTLIKEKHIKKLNSRK